MNAVIRAAEDPRAKLLMLTQWRAGLRVSEVLALDVSDLSLDSDLPTIRGALRQGQEGQGRSGPPGAGRGVQNGSVLWECERGSSHRGAQVHGLAVGAGCGGAGGVARRHCSRPESRDPHASPQLRSAPAHARGPDKLPVALARPLVDTDDADILGAGAGSDGEFGGGAVRIWLGGLHDGGVGEPGGSLTLLNPSNLSKIYKVATAHGASALPRMARSVLRPTVRPSDGEGLGTNIKAMRRVPLFLKTGDIVYLRMDGVDPCLIECVARW